MPSSSSGPGRRGLPRGPHSLTPAEVASSQRDRLIEAMTEAVAENGYVATPVSDVIRRAGVSRKTFYVHFEDRSDCLTAAYEVASAHVLERVNAASKGTKKGREGLTATISTLADRVAQDPAASHLQVLEIAAAGQSALLLREKLVFELGANLRAALTPSRSAPPIFLMRIVADGLLRVIDQRAQDGQLTHPVAIADELARWVGSYHPAPAILASPKTRPLSWDRALISSPVRIGGRAPGTLSLSPLRNTEGNRSSISRSFTAHSQRERILDAVANLCASKGYVGLTVDEIVAIAGVSLNTFYEHFKDKEDAFLVAHELGHVRGTAILEQMLSLAPSWEVGVRDGIGALLDFFYSEPSFARLAAVDAPIASPLLAARARAQLDIYAQLLLEGAPSAQRPPAIVVQAIGASLQAALFAFAVHGVIRDPAKAHIYTTYLVLAPVLGPQKAARSLV